MEPDAPVGWDFFDSAEFPADPRDDPLDRAPVRHVVTAVVVGHDGDAWLPRLTEAMWALERRPDKLIAVDTGSTDDTSALLADLPGADPVVEVSARTGFGTAVARGLAASGFAAVADPSYQYGESQPPTVEWLWLLHDDCAPAPRALEQLLLQATINPDVRVWGPKLRVWPRERELLEVGVTTSLGGRRDTGIEPGEFDQGQHDRQRDVLAVSSAGMLVRRDVWESLGGFDPRLPMFRDDLDFGWRANRAGHRVAVAPDAVVYHAQAAATGERALAGTRRHVYQLDRANAYYTVLANSPGRLVPLMILRFFVGTLLRSIWFVVGKTPSGAVDEWTALLGTLLAGGWVKARRDRRRLSRTSFGDLKHLFARSVNAIRHNLEETGSTISERLRDALADEPDEPAVSTARRARTVTKTRVDQSRWRRQLARRPFGVAWLALFVGCLLAARSVVGSGVLRSAVMLPPHDGFGDLWRAAATAPEGVTPPAWLGQFAILTLPFFGSPGRAFDVLLLGAVPLAALSAWSFLRRIVLHRNARAWGASAYGLAVFAGGAVSQGRLGTCVAAMVLPLLASALHTVGRRRRVAQQGSWRAAWFAGACLAVLLAFTPALALVLSAGIVVAAVVLGLGLSNSKSARQSRQLVFAVALGVLLVLPWAIELVRTPSRLGQEAGGTPTAGIGPGDGLAGIARLLTATPEGAPVPWLLAVPLLLAAVASLFAASRNRFELVGWGAAVAGLLATLVSSRLDGGSGPFMFLVTAGWIGAITAGWDSVGRLTGTAMRAIAAVLVASAVVTGMWWLVRGADDPLERGPAQDLPAYLASAQGPPQNATVIVLRTGDAGIKYALVHRGGPRMGAIESTAGTEHTDPVTAVLAALGGGGAGDEARRLAELGVDYVYFAPPVDPVLVGTLDSVPGLNRASADDGGAAWTIEVPPEQAPHETVPVVEVVHNGWRIAGIVAWLLTLVFCLPTARRAVGGTHMRRVA